MEEAANTMVNYTLVTPKHLGQPIYIQFSNNKELKMHSSPNQVQAQAALQVVNCDQSGTWHLLPRSWLWMLGWRGLARE